MTRSAPPPTTSTARWRRSVWRSTRLSATTAEVTPRPAARCRPRPATPRLCVTGPPRPSVTRPGLRNAPKSSEPSRWSSRVTSVFHSLQPPDLSQSSPATSAPPSTVSQASYRTQDMRAVMRGMELLQLVEPPSVMRGMELLQLVEQPSVMMGMEHLQLVERPSVMRGMELLQLEVDPLIMMGTGFLHLEVHPLLMMNMELLHRVYHPSIMMNMELLCLEEYLIILIAMGPQCRAFWPLTLTAMPHRAVNQGRVSFCLLIILRFHFSSLSSLGSLLPVAQRRAEEAFNTVKEAGAAVMSLFPLGPAGNRNRNSQHRRHQHVQYEDWMPITSPYQIPHDVVWPHLSAHFYFSSSLNLISNILKIFLEMESSIISKS